MLLFYLAVSKNVVKQKFLDFVDKNQVILKKKNLMCLTCRFVVEKCEVQLQGYDRWMKPLFVTFVFFTIIIVLFLFFQFYQILFGLYYCFFKSVLSVLNVQHPVLQCLIRLVHIEHLVKSLTSAKSEDVWEDIAIAILKKRPGVQHRTSEGKNKIPTITHMYMDVTCLTVTGCISWY